MPAESLSQRCRGRWQQYPNGLPPDATKMNNLVQRSINAIKSNTQTSPFKCLEIGVQDVQYADSEHLIIWYWDDYKEALNLQLCRENQMLSDWSEMSQIRVEYDFKPSGLIIKFIF